jgi:hypothetical protein
MGNKSSKQSLLGDEIHHVHNNVVFCLQKKGTELNTFFTDELSF